MVEVSFNIWRNIIDTIEGILQNTTRKDPYTTMILDTPMYQKSIQQNGLEGKHVPGTI